MKVNRKALKKISGNLQVSGPYGHTGQLPTAVLSQKPSPQDIAPVIMEEKEIVKELDETLLGLKDPTNLVSFHEKAKALVEDAYASKNPKVLAMYKKYQNKFHVFVKQNKVPMDEPESKLVEDALIAFFAELKYAPSTLWVIFSCINSYFQQDFRVNMNGFPNLRRVLKQQTEHYVCSKAAVFTPEQIHHMVVTWSESESHRDRVRAMVVLLAYYGLLRQADILKIMPKDVKWNVSENCYEVNFPYKRKRRNNGLTYYIPGEYSKYVERYIGELADKKEDKEESRFLRNMNERSKTRIQNLGPNKMAEIPKLAAVLSREDPKLFSSHSWRRSGATNLADGGCSRMDLKRHGQWKSDTVAESYIANSRPLRLQKVNLLKPAHLRTSGNEKPSAITPYLPALPPIENPVSAVEAVSDKKDLGKIESGEGEKIVSGNAAKHANHYSNCTVVINYASTQSQIEK